MKIDFMAETNESQLVEQFRKPDLLAVVEDRRKGKVVSTRLKYEKILRQAVRTEAGIKPLLIAIKENSEVLSDYVGSIELLRIIGEDGCFVARQFGTSLLPVIGGYREERPEPGENKSLSQGVVPAGFLEHYPLTAYMLKHMPHIIKSLFTPPGNPLDYGPEKVETLFLGTFGQVLDRFKGEGVGMVKFIGLAARRFLAEKYFADEYDAFSSHEYSADVLLATTQPATKIAFLETGPLAVHSRESTTWAFLMKQLHHFPEMQVLSNPQGDFYKALANPHHPRRADAQRIVRKLAFGADLYDQVLPQLFNYIGPAVSGQPNALPDSYLDEPKVVKAVETWIPDLEFIYGPSVRNCVALYLGTKRYKTSLPANPATRTGLIVVEDRKIGSDRFERRIAEVIQLPAVAEKIALPEKELSAEQLQTLLEVVGRLKKDILETSVALGFTSTSPKPGWEILIRPEHPFPSHTVGFDSLDFVGKAELNQKLQLVGSGEQPELTGLAEQRRIILEALAVAAIHDTLPIQQVEATPHSPPSPKPKPSEPSSKPRPTRVIKGKNLLVISDEPVDPEYTNILVQTGNGQAMSIHVDRKPHWSDLVPGITRDAREFALNILTSEKLLDNLPPQALSALEKALLHPEGHRVSSRKIFEDLYGSRRHGPPTIPPEFPLATVLDRFEEVEEMAYSIFLEEYENLPTIPPAGLDGVEYRKLLDVRKKKGPLPRIFDMQGRLEADQERMRELKAEYVVPSRRTSTQTYIPFERYTVNIPADPKEQVRKVKGYLIVPGSSAVEAIMRLVKAEKQ